MSGFEAVDLSEKESFQLVRLSYASDTIVQAYTDWQSDFNFNGNLYSSAPEMAVEEPANTGTFEESECVIDIPMDDDGFADRISRSSPFPPTKVRITQVIRAVQAGKPSNTRVSFRGDVIRAIRTPQGNSKLVRLKCLPRKAQLSQVTMGLPCNHTCINRLGDSTCKVSMVGAPNVITTTTITNIDGQEITLDTVPSGKADRFYHRGYVAFQGLHLGIQEWRNEVEGDRFKFFLVRTPPAWWLGATVTVFAGCDKLPVTCNARFANLDNFNGLGHAMPAYHPSFETGRGEGS